MASNLVHDTNCIISMPEFALRLQISVDDPVTAELFQIFDTVRHLLMALNRPWRVICSHFNEICDYFFTVGNVRNN